MRANLPVWHNPQTVDPIPSHVALEALFLPHSNKTAPYAFVLCIRGSGLDLSVQAHRDRRIIPPVASASTEYHSLDDLEPL